MAANYVLFDFDGTLFDTGPGITNCLREALLKCGYAVAPDDDLKRFVGPPLPQAFREFFGIVGEDSEKLLLTYRAIYAEKGVFDCAPIADAEQFLRRLRERGVKTAVATSKPLRFANAILERFGFDKYFCAVCGIDDDESLLKSQIVAQAMQKIGAVPAETVMIGDRKFDVLGAAANGIPCIGLDTGFGEKNELQKAGAVFVVKTYTELEKLFFEK